MNKKLVGIFSLMIILAFIGYIIYDAVTSRSGSPASSTSAGGITPEDKWIVSQEIKSTDGPLLSVAVGRNGEIFLGGDAYVSCLGQDLSKLWSLKTEAGIKAISVYGDTIFAASGENIYLVSTGGKLIDEWGPYDANGLITSISVNKNYVAFADAGIKTIFVLDKKGEVHSMMGQTDKNFVIPSPYFDVALSSEGILYAANTGHRRIETWTTDGKLLEYFGEPGTAPGAFCGCCNPAHFAVIPQGFVTAEKGINRIKILGQSGEFREFVSANNEFTASVPLDVASTDGITIYAANSENSKLYVFKRK